MKLFKRNMVVLTVLMFVCVAVYLNWSYGRGKDNAEPLSVDKESTAESSQNSENASEEYIHAEDVGLFYVESENVSQQQEVGAVTGNDYFSAAKLSREQSRDSAVNLLHETAKSEDASQQIVDDALAEIAVMAGYTVQEAEIETLLMAKGFAQCVVFIGGDGVSVTVGAPEYGLTTAQVAQITDVVVSETGFTPENIKIVEVK